MNHSDDNCASGMGFPTCGRRLTAKNLYSFKKFAADNSKKYPTASMLDNSHAEAQAFYRKAMALEGLGRPEAAVVVWRQAAKVAPNDLMVRKKLVNAVFWPELGVVFG